MPVAISPGRARSHAYRMYGPSLVTLFRHLLPMLLLSLLLWTSAAWATPEPGESPPGFTLPLLDRDASASLADYRGQWVYVDFWASWCGPCRQSLPLYESMYPELAAQGLQILAINLDERREDAIHFLEKHPVSYTVLWDSAGVTPGEWSIKAMPSSFLLNPEGKLVKSWAGFEETHIEEIRDVLLEQQAH